MKQYIVQKSTRAKRVRITVRQDESITITIPHRMSEEHAHAFFESKKEWIEHALAKLRTRPRPLYDIPKASKKEYLLYKKEVKDIILKRLNYFNQFYNLSWKEVSIKNTTSRWGSCSKQGNLNFNYRLLFLPDHLRDYVVVHELCHLKEMNHSPRFWKLVEKTIPQFQPLKKALKSLS
jgi:predicted metal-dependent hydrolase